MPYKITTLAEAFGVFRAGLSDRAEALVSLDYGLGAAPEALVGVEIQAKPKDRKTTIRLGQWRSGRAGWRLNRADKRKQRTAVGTQHALHARSMSLADISRQRCRTISFNSMAEVAIPRHG
jgi:hypothetical protein